MTPQLTQQLKELNLTWIRDNLDDEIANSIRKNRPHHEIIQRLIQGEIAARKARSIQRRLRNAKIPGRPTLDEFDFQWPSHINADQVRHLFNLQFIQRAANVVFIGTVGLGKTHLAAALAVAACEQRANTLFTSAAAMINQLAEARDQGTLRKTMKRFLRPDLLVLDELGYLPVDKLGAELLFQVIAGRYENASTIITTNRVYQEWQQTFDNDSAITAAVLDRVMHHCETIVIKGKSYRTKDRIEND